MNATDQIAKILRDQLMLGDKQGINATDTLADLGVDSLDRVDIASQIEIDFSLDRIADADSAQFQTVGDLIKYVESKQ